jgi:hypothetical protein
MDGKTRWNRELHGEMTESLIRSISGAPASVRVSTYQYEAGDEIEGTSRPCTVYVMSGSLEVASEAGAALLEQEDVLAFIGGDYTLRIGRTTPAVVVWVWDLPL